MPSTSRSQMATSAPNRARAMAALWPMPAAAPVTTATRSVSRTSSGPIMVVGLYLTLPTLTLPTLTLPTLTPLSQKGGGAMSFSLGAKRVLITGASAGIGAAVAREFAAAGAAVGICARRGERLDQVLADCQAVSADPGSCRRWVVDLARLQGIPAFASQVEEELGPVDVLVNNAGIPKRRTVPALR